MALALALLAALLPLSALSACSGGTPYQYQTTCYAACSAEAPYDYLGACYPNCPWDPATDLTYLEFTSCVTSTPSLTQDCSTGFG